jgi:hypothetical protein
MHSHNNKKSTNKNNFNDKSNNHVTTTINIYCRGEGAEADHQSGTFEREGPAAATTMFQVSESLYS